MTAADSVVASAPNSSVAIVSGGSRGLGLALCTGLMQAGWRVATFSRSPTEAVQALLSDPVNAGRLLFEAIDARDASGTHAFVQKVRQSWGEIDLLVNNAGIAKDGVLATFADDVIDEVIDINLRATLRLTRSCVRQMLTQPHGGNVVNISSIIGQRGYRGLAVYSATKAALDAMTRSLARELGSRKIRVNSIAPGYLRTEMTHGLNTEQLDQIVRRTPLGRLGEPGDIVALLLFLCSDGASFMTGQTFVVDGGLTI